MHNDLYDKLDCHVTWGGHHLQCIRVLVASKQPSEAWKSILWLCICIYSVPLTQASLRTVRYNKCVHSCIHLLLLLLFYIYIYIYIYKVLIMAYEVVGDLGGVVEERHKGRENSFWEVEEVLLQFLSQETSRGNGGGRSQ